MRLIKLTEFRRTYFVGTPPSLRTLQGWNGVSKRGGVWYADLDVIGMTDAAVTAAAVLAEDPEVAELVGAG